MIDLHSHILPNVDDGSGSVEESADMIRGWAEAGFETIVATPHLRGSPSREYAARIRDAEREIVDEFDRSGLELRRGFELMLDPGLVQRLQDGEQLTLAGSTALLVEVPFTQWPSFTEATLFELQLAGYRPILAHPERYDAVQANPQLAIDLGRRGVVLQLTYASLAGILGSAPKRTAERLIELDLPMILASDAHSAGSRLLAVPDGMARAEVLVGSQRVLEMASETPRALLDDTPLPEPVVPASASGKGFLGRLRR